MNVTFREAVQNDVPAIVALLQDDVLGKGRETDDLARYNTMWAEIDGDPNNALIVGCQAQAVVACYQLTIIPGFTLNATRRAEIEGLRVASELRGQGIGKLLIADAEGRARAAGAGLLQLAMNRTRKDALRFYETNGFEASHLGFKKKL